MHGAPLRALRARESSAKTDFILALIWYEQNIIYIDQNIDKELAIICTKAMNDPGYMIF